MKPQQSRSLIQQSNDLKFDYLTFKTIAGFGDRDDEVTRESFTIWTKLKNEGSLPILGDYKKNLIKEFGIDKIFLNLITSNNYGIYLRFISDKNWGLQSFDDVPLSINNDSATELEIVKELELLGTNELSDYVEIEAQLVNSNSTKLRFTPKPIPAKIYGDDLSKNIYRKQSNTISSLEKLVIQANKYARDFYSDIQEICLCIKSRDIPIDHFYVIFTKKGDDYFVRTIFLKIKLDFLVKEGRLIDHYDRIARMLLEEELAHDITNFKFT